MRVRCRSSLTGGRPSYFIVVSGHRKVHAITVRGHHGTFSTPGQITSVVARVLGRVLFNGCYCNMRVLPGCCPRSLFRT